MFDKQQFPVLSALVAELSALANQPTDVPAPVTPPAAPLTMQAPVASPMPPPTMQAPPPVPPGPPMTAPGDPPVTVPGVPPVVAPVAGIGAPPASPASTPSVTLDQIRAKLNDFWRNNQSRAGEIMVILGEINVTDVSQIPPDKYQFVWDRLIALGG